MRHLRAGRKLSRNAPHRRALMRNLTRALVEHERITTTVEKAKEARRFAERLITLAKKGTLHARRLSLSLLPDEPTIRKLFDEIGPRFQDRQGGYTRILKLHTRRLGDGGHTAMLELLKAGETKHRQKAPAPAPLSAPRLTEIPAPTTASLAVSEPQASAEAPKPAETTAPVEHPPTNPG
jgi:large subunit ribosomal protein L17